MNKHILVADDDRSMRSLLQELLEDEAYEVDAVGDGLVAWERLSQHPGCYEAIVLDLQMPGMGGLQLIQSLQAWQAEGAHAVIAMSADYEAIQQAVGMGIDHVLMKPFDLEALLALIADVEARTEELAQSFEHPPR